MAKRQELKKIRSIRELFHGRFTDSEVAMLLDLNRGNAQATVTFILEKDPKDVRMEFEKERLSWEAVSRVRPHCSQRLLDQAKSGKIITTVGMFACPTCDSFWWKNCAQRKKVSRCKKCGRVFDMLNENKWWGWAEFNCTCSNVFHGWCHMQVASPCYQCQAAVRPTRIIPPDPKRLFQGYRRKSMNRHSCEECAHYFAMRRVGTGRPRVFGQLGETTDKCRCAHVATRRALRLPLVIDASVPHDSSGSTVGSFLSDTGGPRGGQGIFDVANLESIDEYDASDSNE